MTSFRALVPCRVGFWPVSVGLGQGRQSVAGRSVPISSKEGGLPGLVLRRFGQTLVEGAHYPCWLDLCSDHMDGSGSFVVDEGRDKG